MEFLHYKYVLFFILINLYIKNHSPCNVIKLIKYKKYK